MIDLGTIFAKITVLETLLNNHLLHHQRIEVVLVGVVVAFILGMVGKSIFNGRRKV